MMHKTTPFVFSLALLVACASRSPAEYRRGAWGGHDTHNVFGDDDRRELQEALPVGRITIGTDAAADCSGFLIAPDEALTVSHCFLNADKSKRLDPDEVKMNFSIWLPKGENKEERTLTAAIKDIRHARAEIYTKDFDPKDVAWVKLDKDLSSADRLPLFELDVRPLKEEEKLSFTAYHNDFLKNTRPSLQNDCKINRYLEIPDEKDVFVEHNCDSQPGSSGAPLFIRKKERLLVRAMSAGQFAREKTGDDGKVTYETVEKGATYDPTIANYGIEARALAPLLKKK